MRSLLSSVSANFSKALVLGSFFPVLLFTILFLWLVDPRLPGNARLPETLDQLEPQWQILLFTLFVLTLSIILYNLNLNVIRLYEGYPWKDTWFGWLATRKIEGEWQKLREHRQRARNLRNELKPQRDDPAVAKLGASLLDTVTDLSLALNDGYPYDAENLLPTNLGNTIRNFEEYPRQRYGVSAIPIWPRLIAKIAPSYAALIDEAKLSLDFTINSSLLAGLSAALTLWFGIAMNEPPLAVLPKALLFALLFWMFTKAAIGRAADWGTHVKSAFDLYRLELLEQLGYGNHRPASLAAEQRIWKSLGIEYSFADTARAPLPYTPAPAPAPFTSVTAPGSPIELEWARGITDPPTGPYPDVEVTFRITNKGAQTAFPVIVTDPTPDHWHFIWGSASVCPGTVSIRATAPVTLALDQLAPGAVCTVCYKLRSLLK